MFKRYAKPTIYTIFALLYLCLGDYLQGIRMYTSPIHGIYLFLTLFYTYKCFTSCFFNRGIKAVAVVFAMYMVYGLFFLIETGSEVAKLPSTSYYFSTYFNSIAPIFVFYYFTEKGNIDKRWFLFIAFVFLFAVYFQHLAAQAREMLFYLKDAGEFTDNSGYYFLSLIPIVALFKEKPLLQYAAMVFLTVMVLMCMKRGAILISVVVDMFIIFRMSKTTKFKFRTLILPIVAIAVVWFFMKDLYLSNEYFAHRVENTMEGNSSNRDSIYSSLLKIFFTENNPLAMLIGNGAYGPARFTGTMAHNDWLEIALSMGFLGIGIYIYYWIVQIKNIRAAKRSGVDNSILVALISIVFINFMKTLFSMSIDDMMIYSTSLMGFCFSQCNEWNINKEIQQV